MGENCKQERAEARADERRTWETVGRKAAASVGVSWVGYNTIDIIAEKALAYKAQVARLREALERIGGDGDPTYKLRGDEFACSGCWAYAGDGEIPDDDGCVHASDCPFAVVKEALAETPAESLAILTEREIEELGAEAVEAWKHNNRRPE